MSLAEPIAVEPLTLADLDRGLSVPERFASIVRAYGDRPAVTTRTETITYAELDRMANRLAHRLLEHGEAQSRIALLMEPRIAMYAALLGTLKAGRVAIVLNPDDPPERLRQLCDYAGISAILVDDQTAAFATAAMGESVPSLRLDEVLVGGESSDPSLPITIQDPSHLVYTSGSTGRPKGVLRSHGSILRVALSMAADGMGMTPGDRVVATGAPWGAQALSTAFSAFLNGATLIPFPAVQRGVTGLADWLAKSGATVLIASSSLCRHFLKTLDEQTIFPGIRLTRVSADAATWDDISALWHHFPNAHVLTSMGATETGTIAQRAFPRGCDRSTEKPPVGWPTTGLSVRIVDDHGEDCPPGVFGTLEMRSRFLALGYWRDPELTERTFSDDADGRRIFHSSDRACFSDDGAIVLGGRRDTVVKIRGISVDLIEVEEAVARVPGIGEAAAVVTKRIGGEPFLVGYVSPLQGLSLTPHKIRALARQHLPGHLTPGKFVALDVLPRAPNGKVDRVKLREWAAPDVAHDAEAPATETERLLVNLWKDAFRVEEVGRGSDFFDLGGDSLIAAVIGAGIHKVTGVELPLGAFLDHPELSALAAFIDNLAKQTRADALPLVADLAREKTRLSDQQMRYWLQSRSPAQSARLWRTSLYAIDGPLDVAAFQAACSDVFERHSILRTRFVVEAGKPLQIVDPIGAPPLTINHFANREEDDLVRELWEEAASSPPFDLTEGPLVRFALAQLDTNRHLFIRSNHHIISDALSWPIFFRDLEMAYSARLDGRSPFFKPLPVQYADYAQWQYRTRNATDTNWWRGQIEKIDQPVERWIRRYMRAKAVSKTAPNEGRIAWGIQPACSTRLDRVAREAATTYYVSRLALVIPVVARLIDTKTVVVGSVLTYRNRDELLDLFGPFAGLAVAFFRYEPDMTFRQHLRSVQQGALESHAHSTRPWLNIAEELRREGTDVPPNPIWVQAATPNPQPRLQGLTVQPCPPPDRVMPRGVVVRFDEANEQDGCAIDFDARVYAPAGIRDFADRIARFAEAVGETPDEPIGRLIELAGVAQDLPQPNSL